MTRLLCVGAAAIVALLAFAAPGAALAAVAAPDSTVGAAAPAITSPQPGTFISSGTTTVSGTRDADQEIQLLSPTGGDPLCIVAADGTTTWSCAGVSLPSGPAVALRAVVTGAPSLSGEITVSVLAAPTVTGGSISQGTSSGVVRGTAFPGASVTATLSGDQRCTSTADNSGAWSCLFDGQLASGQVTASQQTTFSTPSSSNASAPVAIVFDVTRPAAPVLTSPITGAQVPLDGTTYSGTGEDDAIVTVFAGSYSVCSAPVSAGAWSCTAGGVAPGSATVIAVQRDAAGNVGPGSPAMTVVYGSTAAASPKPTARGHMTEAAPLPPAPHSRHATSAPTPQPTKPQASGGSPESALGAWNEPTRFTSAVIPPGSPEQFPWLPAALLALGTVLLLALPARLLAGTISRARDGRPLWAGAAIAGRNHPRVEFETAPTVRLNRRLVGAAALVAAATLIMLSGPVADQPAYLRLLVAVVVALVVVNAVATLVPLWWSGHVLRAEAAVTFLPRYLLLVAVTALASRVFEIHPALLFGLLGSVAVTSGPTVVRRGQLAAVRAASLIALAVAGWLVLGLLPAANGFLIALGAEAANAIVLGAIGSAVLVLIPIGNTSGRSILAWSPPIWAGLTLLAFTIMFAVLSPVVSLLQGGDTVTLLWVATGAFAACSVAAWAWQRFVAPSFR